MVTIEHSPDLEVCVTSNLFTSTQQCPNLIRTHTHTLLYFKHPHTYTNTNTHNTTHLHTTHKRTHFSLFYTHTLTHTHTHFSISNTYAHSHTQHTHYIQDGPRLLDPDKHVLASGKEDILKYITTENQTVRTNNKMVSRSIEPRG